MRIGIITQPMHKNYGGILQNYALQQVLIKMGHTPVTLEGHYCPKWRYLYLLLRTYVYKNERKHRNYLIKPYKSRDVFKLTWKFVYKYIRLSKPTYTHCKESVEAERLDAIIVGSDQVWREKYNNGYRGAELYACFLNHCVNLNIKKLAYAASFGIDYLDYSDEQKRKCSELIQQFDYVSVREESGVELCKQLGRNDAVCVLDPTLLLDKSVYSKLCLKSNKNHVKPVLLSYILDPDNETTKSIKLFADNNNLTVDSIFADNNAELTVNEWLTKFRDADFVITNSYHGTIFSIIFQKQFYSVINKNRGEDRLFSLLSKLGMSERIVGLQLSNFKKIEEIDWHQVEIKLNTLLEESLLFLKNALK